MASKRRRNVETSLPLLARVSPAILLWPARRAHRQLLSVIGLLALGSILVLSYLCTTNTCFGSGLNQSTESSSIWLSSSSSSSNNINNNNYAYLTLTSSSSVKNPQNQLIKTRFKVDQILLHIFGYDYEDYARYRMTKIRQVSFDEVVSSSSSSTDSNHSFFNMKANDVMVFLHMQKTGGSSFDRHLVRDLHLEQPCKCDVKRKKKCRCFRPGTESKYWLFSRYSIGWKCGLHADYTELINCVDRVLSQAESPSKSSTELTYLSSRRFFYLTILRDPVARFLSEFKHVQRGATWKTARHWCDGRLPTRRELPFCWRGPNWRNVTFDEFISCPHNLAFNRQTRMLADLSLVGCYNRSVMTEDDRDSVLLFSAKENLRKMAFFGLCEEQIASQYVFEQTFGLRFLKPFVQYNQTRSHQVYATLSQGQIAKVRERNHLDMQLYSYARQLFKARFTLLKERDSNFEQYYQELVRRSQTQFLKTRLNRNSNNKTTVASVTTTASPSSVVGEEEEEDSGPDPIDDSVEDYYSANRPDEDDSSV